MDLVSWLLHPLIRSQYKCSSRGQLFLMFFSVAPSTPVPLQFSSTRGLCLVVLKSRSKNLGPIVVPATFRDLHFLAARPILSVTPVQ